MRKNKTKKIQIKMFKKKNKLKSLFSSVDVGSLELYAEMMRDRTSGLNN